MVKFKTLISSAVVGLVFGSLLNVAYAASATSDLKSFGPVNSYSYTNSAWVSNDNGFLASKITVTKNPSSGTVPVGYMGASARLYSSTGLCATAPIGYNDVATNTFSSLLVGHNGCGAGNYYSQGYTEVYNGNGYSGYYTNQSPKVSF